MASANSGVSYFQVYKRWLSVDRRRHGESTIPVNIILLKLRSREVVVKSEYQILDNEKTTEGKMLFFKIMPAKGEKGFNQLMEILLENNYNDLTNDLDAERKKWLKNVSTVVNYRELYKSWLQNDRDLNGDYTIPVEVILHNFLFLLTKAEYQIVDKKGTNEKKLKKLFFDILPSKDELGFDQLVKILFTLNCSTLANDLLRERENCSRTDCSKESTEDVIPKKKICLRSM